MLKQNKFATSPMLLLIQLASSLLVFFVFIVASFHPIFTPFLYQFQSLFAPALMVITNASSPPSHRDSKIARIAAAGLKGATFIIAMIFSFFHKIFVMGRKKKHNKFNSSCVQSEQMMATPATGLDQKDTDLKGRGFVISEDDDDDSSLEVFYLRNLEDGRRAITYLPRQENLMYASGNNNTKSLISKPTQDIPKMPPQENAPNSVSLPLAPPPSSQTRKQPPPPPPPPPPPQHSHYVVPPMKRIPLPPPSPPSLPPPPHPHYLQPPLKRIPFPIPPPHRLYLLPPVKRIPLTLPPPPPPPPPTPPRFKVNDASLKNDSIQKKLKPLHWDKVVVANADHSMVWDEINIDGSLRIDDDLMKALFGYSFPDQIISSSSNPNSGPNTQIFILDPRKSQNAAIIIRSLDISQREIIDALFDGVGLSVDILEKLVKICPTKDEEDKLIQFNGNPAKLASAESFLYHILKSVPSAFTRLNSMLFMSSYDNDILHVKESLQTLETACKELRTRGIFFKLLEAILKTGNLMNAGTSRGNAKGFNLNSLRKLSSIKSTDGKTSLLHFVVEQVIYSEAKHSSHYEENCMTLGMTTAISRRLHSEFSNVKKASSLDYYYCNMCTDLKRQVDEVKLLVKQCCEDDRRGCFGEEMKGFVERCEEELTIVKEEETRIMLLVKRTTEYYQVSGDSGTKSLQLFVMVKDFIDMVDQVCLDISSKLEKKMKKNGTKINATSLPLTQLIRLQNFKKPYFTEDRPAGIVISADSDEDDLLSF